MTETCAKFLSLIPRFYGGDLDRKTMWKRISNGVIASLAKAGGSVDSFVNEMLTYVHADPEFLPADVNLLAAIKGLVSISDPDRDYESECLECFKTRRMLLIPMAKEIWVDYKKKVAK